MKLIATLFFICLSINANAEIVAFFSNGRATLVIQGRNSDAIKLYEAMNVAPTLKDNILTKNISYDTMNADPVFKLICNKSQLSEAASCTLNFFSPGAVVNQEHKSVLMGINDRYDAPKTAKQFNQISEDPHRAEVFLSEDKQLRIWKTFDYTGSVVSFTMSFR